MNITSATLQNKDLWCSILEGSKHSFFHTFDCVNALEKTHANDTKLYKFTSSNHSAIVPLQVRTVNCSTDALTPYGYSGVVFNNFNHDFYHLFLDELGTLGHVCSYISTHPLFSNDESLSTPDYYQSNSSYISDLSLSKEQLFKNLKGRKRSQVKLRSNEKVIFDKTLLRDKFIELYHYSMEKLGANNFYNFNPDTLNTLIDSEQTFLIGIESKDEIVACSLFGFTDHISDFLLSGASDEGRKYSSYILWESMLYSKSLNIPYYNLGGGIKKNDGLEKFKSLFGGTPMPFGAYKIIHSPKIYKTNCEKKSIEFSNDLSGFFPAYHIK